MKRRRRFIKMVGLLVTGAALNVAVGWTCVLLTDPYDEQYLKVGVSDLGWHDPDSKWLVSCLSRFGHHVVSSTTIDAKSTGPSVESILPAGLMLDPKQALDSEKWALTVCGWPIVSMGCRTSKPNSGWQIDGGLELNLPPRRFVVFNVPQVLPLRPLWPGFAVNTLFYAGVLWVLFAGPFALRRMIRRRRGRCPACAYPIGQSPVCTECGHLVMPAKAGIQ